MEGKKVLTERLIGQLGEIALLGGITHRVCLNTVERIHVCLAIGTILAIELFLSECLRRCIGIALRRLGVKRTAMDQILQGLVVIDLSTLLRCDGGRSSQIRVYLGLLASAHGSWKIYLQEIDP